jgi:hypothetical protein
MINSFNRCSSFHLKFHYAYTIDQRWPTVNFHSPQQWRMNMHVRHILKIDRMASHLCYKVSKTVRFNLIDWAWKYYILGHFLSVASLKFFFSGKYELNLKKLNFVLSSCTFYSQHSIFEILGNTTIRHNKTAIRHMWRVANGLDNAAIDDCFLIKVGDQ